MIMEFLFAGMLLAGWLVAMNLEQEPVAVEVEEEK